MYISLFNEVDFMVIKKGEIEYDTETKVSTVKMSGQIVRSFASEVRLYGNNAHIPMTKTDGGKKVIVVVDP